MSFAASAAAKPAAIEPARAGLFGTRFVDDNRATINLLPVKSRNRRLRFLVRAHFHKPETFCAAGHPVNYHFCAFHFPMRGKQLPERLVGRVVAQVPNIQFPTHTVTSPCVAVTFGLHSLSDARKNESHQRPAVEGDRREGVGAQAP